MKKEGRTVITCMKILSNGITERFRVVVGEDEVNEAKRNYESRGYKVIVPD